MDDRVNPYAPPADESQAPPLVAEVVVDEAGWTIEYDLTLDDLLEWNAHLHRTSPTARRQFYFTWTIIGLFVVVVSLLAVVIRPGVEGLVAAATSMALGGLLWSLFPIWLRRSTIRVTRALYRERSNYNVFGPRRLTLSDYYVISSSPLSQTIVRWQGVADVQNTSEALYILTSSVFAIVVPRRAFAGQDEFDRFAERAFELRQRAAQAAGTTHLRS